MLKDKRNELDGEKQRKLLRGLLEDLSASRPDLYYQSTSEIAQQIHAHIQTEQFNAEDGPLLKRLSERDIEVLLSLH
ncbi:MAG: hypothetical protein AAGA87_14425 [Pseudomonadota bacterium]